MSMKTIYIYIYRYTDRYTDIDRYTLYVCLLWLRSWQAVKIKSLTLFILLYVYIIRKANTWISDLILNDFGCWNQITKMFILLYIWHTLISKSASSNCFFNLPPESKISCHPWVALSWGLPCFLKVTADKGGMNQQRVTMFVEWPKCEIKVMPHNTAWLQNSCKQRVWKG